MGTTQWCLVALLACVGTALAVTAWLSPDPGYAQAVQQTGGAAQGMLAVAGQVSPGTYGVYLVDLDRGSLTVYEYNAPVRQLRLMAARSYIYDRQLEAYNTVPPPAEVADMVRQARRIPSTTSQP